MGKGARLRAARLAAGPSVVRVTICPACMKSAGPTTEDTLVAVAAFLLPAVYDRADSEPCPFRNVTGGTYAPIQAPHAASVVIVTDELRRAYWAGELPEGPA